MHLIRLPEWVRARGRTLNHFPRLEPARTALLVIDMQRAFVGSGPVSAGRNDYANLANPHAHDIIPNINRLSQALREAGCWIFWSRHTVVTEGPGRLPEWQLAKSSPAFNPSLMEGAPGHGLHGELELDARDVVFDKYRLSCFFNAAINLDDVLKEAGIDTVVITGTLTNCCCECTARDAALRNYKVIFVSDATAAITDEEHNATLLNVTAAIADVISTSEVFAVLKSSAAGELPQARAAS